MKFPFFPFSRNVKKVANACIFLRNAYALTAM